MKVALRTTRRVTFLAPPSSTFRARFRTTTPRIASPAWKTRRSGPPSLPRGGGRRGACALQQRPSHAGDPRLRMLRALGVSAKVLDGGLAASKPRAPLATGQERHEPGALTISPKPALWETKRAVLGATDAPGVCTINALALEVYRVGRRANYGRRGHITGPSTCPSLPFPRVCPGICRCSDAERRFRDGKGLRSRGDLLLRRRISATCDAFLPLSPWGTRRRRLTTAP